MRLLLFLRHLIIFFIAATISFTASPQKEGTPSKHPTRVRSFGVPVLSKFLCQRGQKRNVGIGCAALPLAHALGRNAEYLRGFLLREVFAFAQGFQIFCNVQHCFSLLKNILYGKQNICSITTLFHIPLSENYSTVKRVFPLHRNSFGASSLKYKFFTKQSKIFRLSKNIFLDIALRATIIL